MKRNMIVGIDCSYQMMCTAQLRHERCGSYQSKFVLKPEALPFFSNQGVSHLVIYGFLYLND